VSTVQARGPQADADQPEGWAYLPLGELVEIRYGKGLIQERRRPGKVAVYGSNGVVGQHDEAITTGPTIIIGRKGSVGEVHLCAAGCWPIDTTYFIDKFGPFEYGYLAHALRRLRLSELDKSTAIPGLSRNEVYAIDVPIPPLAEQKRIVAKVEKLLGRVSAARQRLAKAPAILKRFRQSVLAAACSGQLTADWRNAHLFANASTPSASTKIDARATELPDGWCFVRLCEIANRVTDGTHLPPPLATQGVPFVLIGNILDGQIAWNGIRKWVNEETYATLTARCRPERGDVLYTAVGATFGQALEVLSDRKFIFQRHIAHIKPNSARVTSRYLVHALNAPESYRHACEVAKGAAQPTVTLTDLKDFLIPLPSIAEQREIVRRVDALFALVDKIEARVQSATARVEKITQAILARAFRGELVPTEAELARQEGRGYEPASVLLARIKSTAVVAPARKSKVAPRK
jgi:type I restriction enzyme S subunit